MRNGKKVKLEKLFTNLPTPHSQSINPDGLLQQEFIQEDWIKELQESEYFYQDLVEHSHDLICVHDLKGKILYVNQGAAELFGYDKSSILLKNLKDFLVPEVRHEFETYLSTIQRDGMAKGLMLVQTGTGEKRFLEYQNTLRAEGLPFPIVRGMAHDITKRKQSEETLLKVTREWRTTFDSISDSVCLLDLDGKILRCNKAMKNFVGKPFHEIVNHSCWEIILGATTPIENCPILHMRETLHRETVVLSLNGRWFHVAVDPILDETGSLVGAVSNISDITEQKQTEEEIRRNYDIQTVINSFLRLSLENLSLEKTLEQALNLIISIPWLTFESKGALFLVEDTSPTLVMKTQNGLSEPLHKECAKIPFGKCLCGQAALKQEMIFTDCLNEQHEISYEGMAPHGHYCTPILYGGETLGVINLYVKEGHQRHPREQDFLTAIANVLAGIIHQKRREKEFASLQEQVRQLQKMEAIGQLAGGIAHDFNNLLTVIRGYTDMLLSSIDPKNPLYPDTLEIKNASEKAESLTRQLLAFSRRQVLQPKILDLNTLISNMNKMVRRLIGENIELGTQLPEGLEKVKADPGQLEQVIINLAINARDAMPSGGKLIIETASVDLDENYARSHVGVTPGRYLMLSVSDTGVGIPPEIREHIFEPFFTTKEKGKGTGLGLSTVYGIVKQSGGSIWLYSELGHGTTFKIYLPRVEEEVESIEAEDIPQKSLDGAETILVVEDEEVVRRIAVTILQKRGYHILEATNGEEALHLAQNLTNQPIHLMVTDVVMPKMSGPELVKHLILLHPETKVICMSGYTDSAIIHREILKPGMTYLQKPFTTEALARKVREVLDGVK